MISLPLPHSFSDALRKSLHSQHTHSGQRFLVGPSPFEVPESIEAEIASPDSMTLRFWYPNDEVPEEHIRAASKDGSISCRLGRETKKILEVILTGDLVKLLDRGIRLDTAHFLDIGQDSPRARNTFRQNLSVVKLILESIPPEFSGQLESAIQSRWPFTRPTRDAFMM